ncbi:MAG: efflux RND transporter permease subunit [Pirellulales bacterium]
MPIQLPFSTATAMIGMIALSGIVTRDSIILVDFMQQAVQMGRPLFDAILESRVVRLRPILLTGRGCDAFGPPHHARPHLFQDWGGP